MAYPETLEILITHLKKLPGVGRKTAERYAFALLDMPESECNLFGNQIASFHASLASCEVCGALKEKTCQYCTDLNRSHTLCIVATKRDIFPIEETRSFKGFYHVLGTLISPLEGKMPSAINLTRLREQIASQKTSEIIIALESTLEGDATAFYLKEALEDLNIPTYRLALGMPIGSSLEYVDEGTLASALAYKQRI
ncbi:MAG: recombination mediator RecR [Simkaniaceae bacterium]|nr:recombination mediator RecR [Simkaniaceae bacterium]